MNFEYYIPTRILFGPGSLNKLHSYPMPGKKALIVISSGGSMEKLGYLERVENELDQAGVEWEVFSKVQANPILSTVNEGGKIVREREIDFLVGLGGGSSIDTAKAIAVIGTNPGDYWDYCGGITGGRRPIEVQPLPVIAITTTAGTGTEADPWTVITKEETNEKGSIGYDCTYPVLSVVDPDLMMSVPRKLTAFQGFDILFHAVETVLSGKTHVMARMFAFQAIRMCADYLVRAVNDGSDREARENLAIANTLAGFFQYCITAHTIGETLSAYYPKLEHGASLIVTSHAYYEHFIEIHACDDLFIEIAEAMGVSDANDAHAFLAALDKLIEDCGMAEIKMSDYGIDPARFAEFAENTRLMGGETKFALDPAPLSNQDIIEILKKSYR